MRNPFFGPAWILTVLVALSFFIAAGCDTSTEVTNSVTDECLQNTAPVLGDIFFLHRSSPDDNFIPIAKPPKVKQSEELMVQVEFQDMECNLAGGDFYQLFDGDVWGAPQVLSAGLGCSDLEGEGPIAIILDTSVLQNPIGDHSVEVSVRDKCDVYSNVSTGQFKIISD